MVQVRYYAQLKDVLKTSEETISLNFPADEKSILDQLIDLHPKQRELFLMSRVAIEDEYMETEAKAVGGSPELAQNTIPNQKIPTVIDIISPVSGG